MLSRRTFLRSSSLLALAPTVPRFLARSASAVAEEKSARVLVVVEQDGGNDALNTAVPFADPNYAKLRPKLQLATKSLVKLTDALGLHPALRALDKLYQAGQLAVVPGVGYPNPNRSHFESMAVWQTARFGAEDRKGHGWLGRALDASRGDLYSVGIDVPAALRGPRSSAVAFNRPEEVLLADAVAAKTGLDPDGTDDLLAFVHRQSAGAQAAAAKLAKLGAEKAGPSYPQTKLAERLRLVARLLKADLGARVFYTQQTGYDTHARQSYAHSNLLGEFAGAVAAFFADLKESKLADRVALLTFSEFGRTIRENGSAGTDHGTAGVTFLAGPSVKGGVRGTMPSLTDLDRGEPKATTDFRRAYAAVLEDWLGVDSRAALGGRFPKPELFSA